MRRKKWLTPNMTGPKGEPCYVKGENNGVKMDYVYGKGPGGPGYYHLCTKTAYVNLYTRITSECPVMCCACTKAARIEYDEWDDVRLIIHARHLATIPDDKAAKQNQIDGARQTAQAWHNGLQNEQLAIHVVRTANQF